MPLADYIAGLLFLVLTLGALSLGAALVVRRRLPHLTGAPRAAAFGVVMTAALVGVHLAPGLAGVLRREVVLALALAFLIVAWRLPAVPAPVAPARRPEHLRDGRASKAMAAVAGAWTATVALAHLVAVAGTPIKHIDMLSFHLPVVARWIQTGSVWRVDEYLPLGAPGNYPHNGDLMSLAVILPWSNDAFVRFVDVPFLAFVALAVYALARELSAARPPALLLGLTVVTLPIVMTPALTASFPDAVLLATFAAGLLFLVRHSRTDEWSDLVLAGLGLGIAFGTKWYGVSSVAAVLALWTLVRLVGRRPPRQVARQGLALAALVFAAGGVWLVRNLALSGSPFFPAGFSIFGLDVFEVPPDLVRAAVDYRVADYLLEPEIVTESIAPGLLRAYAIGGLVMAGGIVLGIVAALRGGRWRVEHAAGAVVALGAAAILIAAVYSVTPYSAGGTEGMPVLITPNSRYLSPAVIPIAAVAAFATGRLPRVGLMLQAVALLAVLTGPVIALRLPPLATLASLAAVGGVASVAWLLYRARDRIGTSRRLLVAAAGVAFLAVLAGNEGQQHFNANRYRGEDPALESLLTEAPSGSRIGIVGGRSGGISPIYPAFGPRLENTVSYVGSFRDGLLTDYVARHGFTDALARGDYDFLLVREGARFEEIPSDELASIRGEVPAGWARQITPPSALGWARSAGYLPIAKGDELTLLEAPSAPLSGDS